MWPLAISDMNSEGWCNSMRGGLGPATERVHRALAQTFGEDYASTQVANEVTPKVT
jgi:hypothetical protein